MSFLNPADWRGQITWMLVAFVTGFLACFLFFRQSAPPTPLVGPLLPVLAPQIGPTDKPATPEPVKASATAGAVTRVTITRPVFVAPSHMAQPGGVEPAVGGDRDASLVASPGPTATPAVETIVIETTASGTAAASAPVAGPPHVCPPPPVGPIGIAAGPFPGGVALDYQPLRMNVAGVTQVGPAIILNSQMAGVTCAASLEGVSPHLYLFAGAAHGFTLTPLAPQPVFGAGWRF